MPRRARAGRRGVGTNLVRPHTIRGQLTRILLVSLLLVVILLGVTAVREVRAYRASGDTVDAVTLALAVQDVLHEAQRERGLTNGWLGGDGRLRNSVADQRGNTDRAFQSLSGALDIAPPGADQVRSALGQFATLTATRTQIDAGRIPRAAAFQYYTDGINALNHLRLGLDQASDPEVRHGLQTLYALGEAKEQTARERGFLNGVFAADGFAPGEYVQFLDIKAAKTAGLTAFARDATTAQQALLDAVMTSENAQRATESENVAIASTGGPLARSVDSIGWWSQMTAVIDEQRAVQRAVGDVIGNRAEELRREAALTLAGFAVAALLAIAVQIALVLASLRAIVRPLAALSAEADEVASRRLPEVITAWHEAGETAPDPPEPVRAPAGAGAEITAVADALDRVQTTAVELASEQAVMRRNSTESMSNLARRNQNLVRRQLGLISEFEREELDPKALSNLFELDHLATRMRRNAESLLVLVGEGSPRRWSAPIPLTDVIRAALSEVDDYRRVVLRRVDDIAVAGAVVSELAHMLAELIENGLSFSPPDLEVEIYGRRMGTVYLLAVVDHGVGMPPEQLAEANARLRGERDFLVASTRYLGHYVVGRLARRLRVDVELNTSPVSGIVARLLLPAEILDGGQPEQPSREPESAPANDASLFAFTDPDSGLIAAAAAGTAEASEDVASLIGERGPAHSAGDGSGLAAEVARQAWSGPGPAHAAGGPRRTRPPAAQEGRRESENVPAADGAADRAAAVVGKAAAGNAVGDPVDGPARSTGTVNGRVVSATPAEESATQWWQTADLDAATFDSVTAQPVQRTRNGLVKRNKRQRGVEPARPMPPRPPRTPVPERTPEEVRGMLSSFRTGVQRGGPVPDRSPSAPSSAETITVPPSSGVEGPVAARAEVRPVPQPVSSTRAPEPAKAVVVDSESQAPESRHMFATTAQGSGSAMPTAAEPLVAPRSQVVGSRPMFAATAQESRELPPPAGPGAAAPMPAVRADGPQALPPNAPRPAARTSAPMRPAGRPALPVRDVPPPGVPDPRGPEAAPGPRPPAAVFRTARPIEPVPPDAPASPPERPRTGPPPLPHRKMLSVEEMRSGRGRPPSAPPRRPDVAGSESDTRASELARNPHDH